MKIIIPTRPQVDTTIAIFILKNLGKEKFPGVELATVVVDPLGKKEDGDILLDVGGGEFDHHGKDVTATDLVVKHLDLEEDRSLGKLISLANRDDKEGKGTVSDDVLDKAFGFPGLITAMNKIHSGDPNLVVNTFLPVLDAHYKEERKRLYEMPQEVENLKKEGKLTTFSVKQRKKKLDVVLLSSDNTSLPGYLRSSIGGRFDVVCQIGETGHTNIMTRPMKRVDLRSLAVLLRLKEISLDTAAPAQDYEPRDLAVTGKLHEGDKWYFDDATNSILNGGVNPGDIKPTSIKKEDLLVLLQKGLSEEVWSPLKR